MNLSFCGKVLILTFLKFILIYYNFSRHCQFIRYFGLYFITILLITANILLLKNVTLLIYLTHSAFPTNSDSHLKVSRQLLIQLGGAAVSNDNSQQQQWL